MLHLLYAVLAGVLGACASTAAKMGLTRTWTISALATILMCLSNSFMWTFFNRAMAMHPSSATVNGISQGANIIASGLLGAVFFSESLSLNWWIGVSLIIVGMYQLTH